MDDIYEMARSLYKLQVLNLRNLKERVRYIISCNNKDVNLISHTLDDILDSYYFFGNKEVEDLYWLLCDYLEGLDKEVAKDYMTFLSEAKKENTDYVIQ